MRMLRPLSALFVILLAMPSLYGQDKQAQALPDVPVKVQILLTELSGSEKINSLPYTLYTVSNEPDHNRHNAHLRLGVKVPITVEVQLGTTTQVTYQDVGTNIDCTAD